VDLEKINNYEKTFFYTTVHRQTQHYTMLLDTIRYALALISVPIVAYMTKNEYDKHKRMVSERKEVDSLISDMESKPEIQLLEVARLTSKLDTAIKVHQIVHTAELRTRISDLTNRAIDMQSARLKRGETTYEEVKREFDLFEKISYGRGF
jgi:hypothetical protein